MLMDQVDTLHVGRYWSEVLCSFFLQTIKGLYDLPASPISTAEMSDVCVSKFASLSVRLSCVPLKTINLPHCWLYLSFFSV